MTSNTPAFKCKVCGKLYRKKSIANHSTCFKGKDHVLISSDTRLKVRR